MDTKTASSYLNIVAVINAGIKHKKIEITFNILKKHIQLLQATEFLGYFSCKFTENNKKQNNKKLNKDSIVYKCTLIFSLDIDNKILLRAISCISSTSRKLYTHKNKKALHSIENKTYGSYAIVQTSKGIITLEVSYLNNIGGICSTLITI